MNKERIWDATESDFEKLLIGRRVVAIAGDTIELDNGVIVTVEDTADCCAWFNGEIDGIAPDLTENIITAVKIGDNEPSDSYLEAWSIHVLAVDKTLFRVDIEGTESSGYYCHSINLTVKTKKENGQ